MADRVLSDTEPSNELDVDPGLLLDLADRRLLDGLARLDAASGDDRRELGLVGDVEDEQLVGARLRVLPRDVSRDGRPRPQVFSALSLAL
jgi:hypothetical protein